MNESYWYKSNENFKTKKAIFLSMIILGISVSGILGFLSFKQVNYNQYGLKQNIFTKEIDTNIYTEGLHLVGFWNEFIIFPSTYITIEFTPSWRADDIPIGVQTKNGLLVKLDLSFQYRIRQSDLLNIYSDYGNNLNSYIIAVSRSALREVVGSYNAESLYANRTEVNNAMSNALYNSINNIVEVGNFQLRAIDFPETFEIAVEQYEVWRIEVQIAQLEQETEIVRQKTLTLVEQYSANRTVIEYQGLIDALENMRVSLNMTTDDILTYLWIQTIREHDQSYLFIGLQDIPILIPVSNNTI